VKLVKDQHLLEPQMTAQIYAELAVDPAAEFQRCRSWLIAELSGENRKPRKSRAIQTIIQGQ
jgi:hypothetical protein